MGDVQSRTSSTASSQRADCLQAGESRQIRRQGDSHAPGLVQTVWEVVRTVLAVPQTEPVDGRYGHPSSMPDERRQPAADRNVAGWNAADQSATNQVVTQRAALNRTVPGLLPRILARTQVWDGIPQRAGVQFAQGGRFQTTSSAEIRFALQMAAVPQRAEQLADDPVWPSAWAIALPSLCAGEYLSASACAAFHPRAFGGPSLLSASPPPSF